MEEISRILSGPEHPDHPFVLSRHTYASLYDLAGRLADAMPPAVAGPICIGTEDRGLIAATLLASLATGTPLVFPYSLSPQALAEIHGIAPFRTAVGDRSDILPPGVVRLRPPPHPGNIASMCPSLGPDDEWVRFFTGGSTGRPKLWSKTVRNLMGEALSQARRFKFSERDRVLATVPPYHIYGFLYSILAPLVSSAAVIPETASFPEEIRSGIRDRAATLLVSVPMHYRVLNGARIPGGALRRAFSSAGKLDGADADRFYDQTGVDLVEIYGSTETGGIAGRCRARGETALTPFEEVDWKVEENALLVRSDFLSPELPRDDRGYFRTGDRARSTDNGTFDLLGRADGIVKVGGNRVDLEAVQNTLRQIPQVEDIVVIARAIGDGRENEICALVQGKMAAENFRAAAARMIEPHALPRRIQWVHKMPLRSTGKYDRKAIERMFASPAAPTPE
jgi:acyl-coenzyme A synthetase/AMP-(fatty) acid ligase